MAPEHAVERCARACAEPAWRLACGMLRDAHEAFDAVQQAFLVAARKPDAVPAGDPWPWFRVVVAHEALNLSRKRRPSVGLAGVGADDPAMDAPDPRTPSPSDALAAADEARRVSDAVEALASPEREAVLLVHVAELSHAAAAEVLGVARQTVTERARRGLETLGRRLGRPAGATTGALAFLPVAPPPAGLEAATRAWVHTAMGGGASGVGAATAALPALGGQAMAASNVGWSIGLLAAAGIGFFGGGATRGLGLFAPAADEAPSRAPAPATLEATSSGGGAPSADARSAPSLAAPATAAGSTADAIALRRDNERLAARVAALEGELATRPKAPASKGPTFTFGAFGTLDAVREADWPTLGAASKVVGDAVVEMLRHADEGTETPRDVMLRLQENVEKMRTYEYRTIDRIPTAARHNGELTHPITATNLLASTLAQAGKPLSAPQVAEFERLGVAFDEEFGRLRATWDATVPRVRRVLDEMRLKGRFMDAIWNVLTDDQKPLWIDPALRGLASVDLYDPTLMVIHTSPVVTGATAAEMRPKLLALLRPKVGAAADVPAPRLEAAVDQFLARATKGLEPVTRARARNYTFAQAVAAGEASVELVETLLRDPDLATERRAELFDDPSWYVPRILAR